MRSKTKTGRTSSDGQRKTNELLRSILEVASFGVYIVNQRGGIDYVNASMIAISGDTYEQFSSLNVFRLPSYKKIGLDMKIRAVFEGEAFALDSIEYTSHYSKKTTVRNFVGIPFKEDDEKKALIYVEDITKIKRAEEEMQKAIAIKSLFISMVSHELRTPLTAIGGAIDLIAEKGPLTETQRKFWDIVKRNVDRLGRLTTSVLDYQKLEAGRATFAMAQGDINAVIRDVARQMEAVVQAKGLALNLSLGAGLPPVSFDSDKITQVLFNLANNAMKFTKTGSITISSERVKDTISVSVADTGIGVREEDMPKLFRSFSQIPVDGHSQESGTGLGLAISKGIVTAHRGTITVRSVFGKGSIFSFSLPLS